MYKEPQYEVLNVEAHSAKEAVAIAKTKVDYAVFNSEVNKLERREQVVKLIEGWENQPRFCDWDLDPVNEPEDEV